ncbi:MAG: hypothetical protein U1C57_02830 [Candidatus Doudnabacteria bacterium]|nr:hypothetical protein [bacterium]MDZ4244017.1 hypothetical protein [Candidatus Doudnabacteria bacterium]
MRKKRARVKVRQKQNTNSDATAQEAGAAETMYIKVTYTNDSPISMTLPVEIIEDPFKQIRKENYQRNKDSKTTRKKPHK